MQKKSIFLKAYIIIALLGGFGTVFALLGAPSEAASAWAFGFSRLRTLMILAVLAALFFLAAMLILLFRNVGRAERVVSALAVRLSNNWVYVSAFVALWLTLWASIYSIVLAGQITDNLIRVRLMRIAPILFWLVLLSLQTLVLLPLLRFTRRDEGKAPVKGLLWPTTAALISFALAGFVMNATGLGLTPDLVGWDNFGAPILITQVILSSTLALGLWGLSLLATSRIGGREARRQTVDVIYCALIWLAAFILWNAEPLSATFFSPAPRAPNFAYYPHSDAALHDIAAQNVLIGEGYSPAAEKPLYSFFLLIAHLLFGQDYEAIVTLQVAGLALFPVIAYLLGKTLHHRLTGLLLAGLLIYREQNTIALSSVMRVSHAKLLMTDLPAAMAIALFILLALYWLGKKRTERAWAVLAGGALGAVLLIRSQAIIFMPVFLAVLFLTDGRLTAFLRRGALFAFGTALVILPWMARNYLVTGVFGYSQPRQAAYLARQYTLTPESDPDTRPGNDEGDGVVGGFSQALSFAREHPDVVLRFVSSHFLRNEVSALFALPVSFSNIAYNDHGPYFVEVDPFLWHNCCSLNAFAQSAPYWPDWDGVLAEDSLLPVATSLVLVALGIGIAWRQAGAVGLLPLWLHLAYNFSVAIARISGWRLILPVDWIAIFYYCIGLSGLLLWMLKSLSGGRLKETAAADLPPGVKDLGGKAALKKAPGVGMLLLLMGASIPLAEGAFPQKYAGIEKRDAVALVQGFEDLNPFFPTSSLQEESKIFALEGVALYPRFYAAGEGEPAGNWPNYNPQPFNRLGFQLLGPDYEPVIVPLNEAPDFFPDGADVVILGCRSGQYVLALAVVLVETLQEIVWANQLPEGTCELN